MTLADLAAILGLAVLAVVYVGFRLGEKGGCPSCGGPGACAASSGECAEEEDGSAPPSGEGESDRTSETALRPGGRGR